MDEGEFALTRVFRSCSREIEASFGNGRSHSNTARVEGPFTDIRDDQHR